MGLFDKFLSTEKKEFPLTKQEALFSILLLTTLADGELSDEECDDLIDIASKIKLLRDLSGDELRDMVTKILDIFTDHGLESLLKVCAGQLSMQLRETAFVYAADLIFSDGCVDENEASLLEAIRVHLEIPEDLALYAVKIAQIKNSG